MASLQRYLYCASWILSTTINAGPGLRGREPDRPVCHLGGANLAENGSLEIDFTQLFQKPNRRVYNQDGLNMPLLTVTASNISGLQGAPETQTDPELH